MERDAQGQCDDVFHDDEEEHSLTGLVPLNKIDGYVFIKICIKWNQIVLHVVVSNNSAMNLTNDALPRLQT